MNDFTYSQGCGCQVTFFAASDYHTSRMLPGPQCQRHVRLDQMEARDSFVEEGREMLAEYRHKSETVRRYLMAKRHGDVDLYAIVDESNSSGFMPMRQALTLAGRRFGKVTLDLWNCDSKDWDSELVADPNW